MLSSAKRLRWALCFLLLAMWGGCAKPAGREDFLGRWLAVKDDSFVEFTPAGLMLVASAEPISVETFQWELEASEEQVVGLPFSLGWTPEKLKSGMSRKKVRWSYELDGQRLSLQRDGQVVQYKKLAVPKSLGSSLLVGLWRQSFKKDGLDLDNYAEFTPWGSAIMIRTIPVPKAKRVEEVKFLRFADWYVCKTSNEKMTLSGYSMNSNRWETSYDYKTAGKVLTLKQGKGKRDLVKAEHY